MTEYPAHVARIEDDPKRPYKAYASTALTVLAAFVTYWIADVDPFTTKEIAQGCLIGLVSGGLIGGTTFAVRNPKRARTLPDQRGAVDVVQALLVVFLAVVILVVLTWLIR